MACVNTSGDNNCVLVPGWFWGLTFSIIESPVPSGFHKLRCHHIIGWFGNFMIKSLCIFFFNKNIANYFLTLTLYINVLDPNIDKKMFQEEKIYQ